ncbi:hypothetical protein PHMEG_00029274 [Phytophthora megakarya]|uniref:Uncharacterized protein n=1 Tax=Phytophthora megakarya TaxID=4795 RepID=A0A225V3Y9_9STRA|nr:hypothetical protein PHMEG_00029274 [Phytophthora megakarya]
MSFCYNVSLVNAVFAALLIHLDEIPDNTRKSFSLPSHITRYLYVLERGVAATNARLGSSVSVFKCCEWGEQLKAHCAL